ncbi:molybdenum cofactor biosynthesis protein B [Terasakiella sp. A23]|uniref:molybdenum cofactor biosynthesis protein B n=1 Tax=Terasakiella sp. FCG-A23 TaxID=3080561 RepID=UPI0029542B5E|nr:molybdenum cofactor biosynthesis protein B [Terasakiella sp. A23]MDV7340735.1 molybdenum cofactor biosynthesis protein B [Terasakiella sp. A23]
MSKIEGEREFQSLNIAIITVSDTRTFENDKSGDTLVGRIEGAGHKVYERLILKDEADAIADQLRAWADNSEVDVVITTGGTGVTGRDVTPEAFKQVIEKEIPGFGEIFRMLSYQKIKASTIQSRAMAGVVNATYMFALPGSSGAVKDAWDDILEHQLDARTRPCNFVELMPRLNEHLR